MYFQGYVAIFFVCLEFKFRIMKKKSNYLNILKLTSVLLSIRSEVLQEPFDLICDPYYHDRLTSVNRSWTLPNLYPTV